MMSSETETIGAPPSVLWAQTNEQLLITFIVQCEKPHIQIKKGMVSFKGTGMPEEKLYHVEIPLYAEIDPKKSTYNNKGRVIEVVLTKKNQDAAFWPYLTYDKKKHHWLKIDFNRWQDEDDSEDEDDISDSMGFDENSAQYDDNNIAP